MDRKTIKNNGFMVSQGRTTHEDLSAWYKNELKGNERVSKRYATDTQWPESFKYQHLQAASQYFTDSLESPDKTAGKGDYKTTHIANSNPDGSGRR